MNRISIVMLNYRPNGWRRLGRPSKRLLDEAETGLLGPKSWRVMMMMMMVIKIKYLQLSKKAFLLLTAFSYNRFQQPRRQICGSAAVRLLALWVWISSELRRGCLSVVSVVCRQEEVPATGRSLDQRSSTDCGVSECNLETATMRRPSLIRVAESWNKKEMFTVGFPCILYRGGRNIRRMALDGITSYSQIDICSYRIALQYQKLHFCQHF